MPVRSRSTQSCSPYSSWLAQFLPAGPCLLHNPQGSAGWGNVQLVARVLENRLSLASPYLFGDWFTAADLIVGGAVNWAMQFGMFPKTPAMSAYAQRMTERPAFQRAFATQNS